MKPEVIRAIRRAIGNQRRRELLVLKLDERIEDLKTADGLTHWVWLGPAQNGKYKYPKFHIWVPDLGCHISVSAAKLAYAAFTGKIVARPSVLVPICESRLCINPLHYLVGTVKDIGARMKGRPCPNRILSFQDAEKIRRDYAPYSRTKGVRALARKYGINPNSVSKIVNGSSYLC